MNTETATPTKKPSKRERERDAARREATRNLVENYGIKPGSRVYTVLKHCSSSGMSRRISCLVVDKDGRICNISTWVADVLDWRWSDGAVVVSGCGTDMGFHIVYSLSSAMFRETQGSEAGYALKQEWL